MAKLIRTRGCGWRRCKRCKGLYRADVRNRRRQQYCGKTDCRRASKKASQNRWLRSDKGQGYFRGPQSVERVRQWRAAHPGYSRRGVPQGTLQDVSTAQVIDKQVVTPVDSSASALFLNPLQDLCTSQPALLIGLIASLTGSALQDDIAETTRRFIHSGQDILRCSR